MLNVEVMNCEMSFAQKMSLQTLNGTTDDVTKFLQFLLFLGMFRHCIKSTIDDYAEDGGPEALTFM